PFCPSPESFPRSFVSSKGATLLAPFVEIDCERDAIREIAPARAIERTLEPEAFGDNWSDELDREDVAAATRYLVRKEKLRERVGAVTLRVGGKEHRVDLSDDVRAGVTIE